MITVLRQRDFGLLWTGGLISATGDWALFIALPIYVYRLTGSALATSGMFVAGLLPFLLLGSVAGVFVDRWDRKRAMVVSNLLLTVVLLPLLVVHSAQLVWIVYVVAFVESAVVQFFSPAEHAMLPTVVGEEHLVEANSLGALNRNLARLIGPSLGGVVAAFSGLGAVTLLDASSFVLAAGMIALVTVSGRVTKTGRVDVVEEAASSWRAVWREWLAGLALVRRERFIAVMLAVAGIASLGEGVFAVMFVVWVRKVLGGGALELGWFMTAQAVGGLLGGLVIGYAGKRITPVKLAGLGAVIFALLDISLFSYPLFFSGLWLGLLLIILVGVPVTGLLTGSNTILQRGVEDEYRGRVFGAMNTTQGLLQLVGTLIAGAAGAIVSPIVLLNVFQGGSYLVAGSVVLALLPGAMQRRKAVVPEGQTQAI